MPTVEMIALLGGLLRGLAIVSRDPALGYRGAAITSILNLGALALERGSEGREQLQTLADEVAAMATFDVEPTKDQWQGLKSRSDAAHAILNPPAPLEE